MYGGIRLQATLILIVASGACLCAANAIGQPFYMGADVSLTPFVQQQGAQFYDYGVQAPLDTILYEHGANLFRLRIFVNPQTVYSDTGPNANYGAIQTTAYDVALAQQIKAHAPNAKFLLDFHYSDTWADPGKQTKPAAWTNQPLPALQSLVQTYTRDTLQAFKDAGVMPDMVQVGNEISSGMLWGTGSGANSAGGRLNFSGTTAQQQASWQNLGSLLNSAIQGVRQAQAEGPKIDIAVHIDRGDQNGHPQYYFGNLTNPAWGNVSDFDVIGVSYYPTNRANHSLGWFQTNLNALANDPRYADKKIMCLETNMPWEQSGVGLDPPWPKTPAGQKQFLLDLQNVMLNIDHDAGAGIVWWFPEAVDLPGYNVYNGGSTALFDNSHNTLPALDAFGLTLASGDYDFDRIVDGADLEVWNNLLGQAGGGLNADGNGDGVVDGADVLLWQQLMSAAGSGAIITAGAIPEPTSATLGLILLATAHRLFAGARRPR